MPFVVTCVDSDTPRNSPTVFVAASAAKAMRAFVVADWGAEDRRADPDFYDARRLLKANRVTQAYAKMVTHLDGWYHVHLQEV